MKGKDPLTFVRVNGSFLMLINFVVVAAGFLDIVEGAVGLAENGGQVAFAAGRADGDADAGSDVAGSPTDNESASLFEDEFSNPPDIGFVDVAVFFEQEQSEFIAAESADMGAWWQEAPQHGGKFDEDVIAVLMAIGIIGLFEMVEVDDKEGGGPVFGELVENLLALHCHSSLVEAACEMVGFGIALVIITVFLQDFHGIEGLLEFEFPPG